MAASSSRDTQLLGLPDGRTLCFAEWGDPHGFPVFLLHGTPGARWNRPDEEMLIGLGARVITYDRPGYGRSARRHGRRLVDCVDDVAALADRLGLDRFSVTGSSGGGMHVLAVAARLGDRVERARCNVAMAPYEAEDLNFFAGMDPANVAEFGWALEGEQRLTAELERQLEELRERMAADPQHFLGEDWQLDASDREVFADPVVADQNAVVTAELVRGGAAGWIDDSLAFVRPWGFDVGEIDVRIRVTYGAQDVIVPPGHGEWLGRHVPGAEVIVEESLGHLSPPAAAEASIRWLVSGR